MITKTDAIILRVLDYSESSLIVTILSRKHGKVSLMARGARRTGSRQGGILYPGNLVSVVYHFKPSRSLQTLREASIRHRLDSLNREMEKMALVMSTLELVSQLVHEGEENEPVHTFLERFLIWLDRETKANRKIFPYLQVRLAALLGFGFRIGEIDNVRNSGYLNIETGTLSSATLSEEAVRLNRNQFDFLLRIATSRKAATLETDLRPEELRFLIATLDRYFQYHLEGFRPRRSDAIFDQILYGSP